MSAESTILSDLKQYELGVVDSATTTLQLGTLDSVTATIISQCVMFVPFVAQAIQIAGAVLKELNSVVGGGPYSELARVGNDVSSFNIVGLYNDLLNGRTFNTDQYWGAVYYYRYVVGSNVNNQNQVSDQQVLIALEWFIMKLGVFISGREHLEALQVSAEEYMNLYSVNSDTTTDNQRVANAVYVMQKYMPTPGFSQAQGIWANTVGVFDPALVDMLQNSAAYNAALANAETTYQATDLLPGQSTPGLPGTNVTILGLSAVEFSAIAAIIIIIIIII
jgi:hypothetical protein